MLTDAERRVILAIQHGLPLVPEPYAAVARDVGLTEDQVIDTVRGLLDRGVIKRLGAVPNHYALGITANGMSVWDIPEDRVSDIGRRLGARPEVTHCYRRPRHEPDWPYTLFAMVHGTDREDVRRSVDRIARDLGLEHVRRDVLFSSRILKKVGTKLSDGGGAA